MLVYKYAVVFLISLFFTGAFAGDCEEKKDKPSLSSSTSMMVSALVEAVDYDSREVTLKDPSGELISFVAGDEVKNLAQMKAGDIVNARYTENLYIDVLEGDGAMPAESEFTAVGTAKEGMKPGLSAFDSQVVTATVEAIDIEANTFQLKWPDDSVTDHVAENPENLKKTDVGDLVVITQTVEMDITVEEMD